LDVDSDFAIELFKNTYIFTKDNITEIMMKNTKKFQYFGTFSVKTDIVLINN